MDPWGWIISPWLLFVLCWFHSQMASHLRTVRWSSGSRLQPPDLGPKKRDRCSPQTLQESWDFSIPSDYTTCLSLNHCRPADTLHLPSQDFNPYPDHIKWEPAMVDLQKNNFDVVFWSNRGSPTNSTTTASFCWLWFFLFYFLLTLFSMNYH